MIFDGSASIDDGGEFGLERFQKLLLSVWREACRHIELSESTATIAESLSGDLPLDFVLVRFFDGSIRGVRTLAVGQAQPRPFHLTPDTIVSQARWERLLAWAARGDVLASPANRRTGEVSIIVPPELEGDVLAGPLVGRDGPVGALVFTAQHSRAFREADIELFRLLMEPFSVALENHLRLHELSSLREAADSEKRRLLKRLGKSEISDDVIVGADGGLRSVMERVDLVSTSDVPILILGETGTGKEVVSRAIHNRSSRAAGPFIRVNCGAIPSELLDSQLFGHERGSFTGADATRQGWFERADGGTLFLDEIGELPAAAQVRLLRVLQDSFIERVGGQNPIRVDVRIVAATHRDLPTMVRSGHFREDLWYRVNVFPLLMPPLRDRAEDIPLLAKHFTMRAATRFGLPYVEPSPQDLAVMLQYPWPGNIRELAAVIDRAVILGEGTRLDIKTAIGGGLAGSPVSGPGGLVVVSRQQPEGGSQPLSTGRSESLADSKILTLDEAMKRHIERVLDKVSGKIEGRGGAAAVLGINPHTLRARMRKLGVQWSKFRDSGRPEDALR